MFTISDVEFDKRIKPFLTQLVIKVVFLITIAMLALFWPDNRRIFGIIFLFGVLVSIILDSSIVDIKVAKDYWKNSYKADDIKIIEIKDAILYRVRPSKCINKLTVEILSTGKNMKMYMYLSDREANDLICSSVNGKSNTYRAIYMEASKAIIKLQKLKINS